MIESLASLSASKREKWTQNLTEAEAATILWDWRLWARPKQLEPEGDWLFWFIKSGRGFGKTRAAAEWIRHHIDNDTYRYFSFVGPTYGDLRRLMIEGESGILSVFPPDKTPKFNRNANSITFYNGAEANCYTAKDPERIRGSQCQAFWAEELASWPYVQEAWDQLMFAFRLPHKQPRGVITSTPRPIKLVKELVERDDCHVTSGASYENQSNLSPAYYANVIKPYEGTRLGRQEIEGEILDDVPGALWQRAVLERQRIREITITLKRIVVAIDPSISAGEDSHECGMVVAGLGSNDQGYLLEDLSERMPSSEWGARAVAAYHRHEADCIVAEVNNGGDLVETQIKVEDKTVPVKQVRATRGKAVRAEPIARLYEQGQIWHLGAFPALEDQMCAFLPLSPDDEPNDRVDADVWAFTDLMLTNRVPGISHVYSQIEGGDRDPSTLRDPWWDKDEMDGPSDNGVY